MRSYCARYIVWCLMEEEHLQNAYAPVRGGHLSTTATQHICKKIRHKHKDRDNKLFQKVFQPLLNPGDLFQVELVRGFG